MLATAVIVAWLEHDDTDPIAQGARCGPDAVAAAASFIEATYAHDLDRAADMLADHAEVNGDTDLNEWREWNAWTDAAGFSLAEAPT